LAVVRRRRGAEESALKREAPAGDRGGKGTYLKQAKDTTPRDGNASGTTQPRSAPTFDENIEQSMREGDLFRALAAEPWAAMSDRRHRQTICGMSDWTGVLGRVERIVGRRYASQIAEVLCAASLWNRSMITIGDRTLGRDALNFRRWFKAEKKRNAEFVRRATRLVPQLKGFHNFLAECPDTLFPPGYRECFTLATSLIKALENRAERSPSLAGTLLQSPNKTSPKNFAACVIYNLLRKTGMKKQDALDRCDELLRIAFRASPSSTEDPLHESIWQGIVRARRQMKRASSLLS